MELVGQGVYHYPAGKPGRAVTLQAVDWETRSVPVDDVDLDEAREKR